MLGRFLAVVVMILECTGLSSGDNRGDHDNVEILLEPRFRWPLILRWLSQYQ